uniref:Leucine-rich repeat-containing N-terminal plant-type domain-containing protein n=1 Tax=Opuntia streptacantha TaxID=393608 RepID=A0A7C9EHX2_OPUST
MMMIVFGLQGNSCWGCLTQEKAALLHLKALFEVAQHDLLASWTDTEKSDCCDGWEGVACGSNGRVFSLSLPKRYDDAWDDYDTSFKQLFDASVLLPFQDIQELHLSRNGIFAWTEAEGT